MAIKLECETCDFTAVVRKENVSEYAECGMGGTVHQIASRLKDDHMEYESMMGEYHKVMEIKGSWDAWNREFVPDNEESSHEEE